MPWRENEHGVNTEYTEITESLRVVFYFNHESHELHELRYELWGFSHRSHRFSQIFIRAIREIRVQKILIRVRLLLMTLVLMILSCCPSAPRPEVWAVAFRSASGALGRGAPRPELGGLPAGGAGRVICLVGGVFAA